MEKGNINAGQEAVTTPMLSRRWIEELDTSGVGGWPHGLWLRSKSVGTNLVPGDASTNVASGMLYKAYGALRDVAYGNGQQLRAEYSFERHQLTGLSVMKQSGQDAVYDLVFDYYAGGGNNGRIQHVDDYSLTPALTIAFTYDHYNRLVDTWASSYRRSYTFDAWGNLRGLIATGEGISGYSLDYDLDENQVPISNRVSNSGYGYDAAGNLTSNGADTFTYDGASRQKTGRSLTVNDYDGDGNRIKHSTNSGTVRYLWSSVLGEAVLEHDVNLGTYRQYVYTPGGALIALRSYDSQFYWVHEDRLGSGRRLTDQAGTLVHQMELDPHGTIVRENPPNNYLNSHKFTGYERDWSTETDNAKARTYDSRIGRFLQPDPLGVAAADLTGPQSLNRYSYVENDPVNNVDPLGLMTCFGYHAYSVLVDSETGAVIGETYLGFMPQYCWDEQTGGTVGGGGGGGQAPQQQKKCPDDPKALADVNALSTRAGLLPSVLDDLKTSQSGKGQLFTVTDSTAAAKIVNNKNLFVGGDALGGAFHEQEIREDLGLQGRDDIRIVDYRSFNAGKDRIGKRSLQVTVAIHKVSREILGGYMDTDRFVAKQDVAGFFGHFGFEVLPFVLRKYLLRKACP